MPIHRDDSFFREEMKMGGTLSFILRLGKFNHKQDHLRSSLI